MNATDDMINDFRAMHGWLDHGDQRIRNSYHPLTHRVEHFLRSINWPFLLAWGVGFVSGVGFWWWVGRRMF